MIAETTTVMRDVPIRNYVIAETLPNGEPTGRYHRLPAYDAATRTHGPIIPGRDLREAARFASVADAVTHARQSPVLDDPDKEGLSDRWTVLGILPAVHAAAEAAAQHAWNHRNCHPENGKAA